MNDSLTWKEALLSRCRQTLASLPEDLPSTLPTAELEEISIYEIQAQLSAMRAEMRKVNRRTADTFTSFNSILEGVREDNGTIRETLLKNQGTNTGSEKQLRQLSRSLIDLLDRLQRMGEAIQQQSEKGWTGIFQSTQHLKQQHGSVSILLEHGELLLDQMNVKKLQISRGDPFNPLLMKAVGSLPSDTTDTPDAPLHVHEELLTGYTLGEHCLRTAEVSLTRAL